MSLTDTGWSHEQQTAIDWKLFNQSLRREFCVVLRSAGRTFESCERTIGIAPWNARCRQQLFRTIRSATRTNHCALHRIDFRAGAEAFRANLCALRLAEFSLVYQVKSPGIVDSPG